MLKVTRVALTAGLLLAAGSALSAERAATLEVENVSCVTCAPMLKRAIGRIAGVNDVTVAERPGGSAVASITYDDARVRPEALARASAEAGFPARVRAY
ncbi:heavy-metal-associated domain-containing protein [Methylobacterium iners]|uniref:heavy-metal-associated domain-containing protein n=1 Tax=Methylobacterium iners TaxID=418707 RepID=UPI00360DA5E1